MSSSESSVSTYEPSASTSEPSLLSSSAPLPPPSPPPPLGARVMDLKCLSEGVTKISEHGKQCSGKSYISSELYREGLASVLEVSCDGCEEKFTIQSSDLIAGSGGLKKRYSVNVGAVWGQMATGGGQRNLNELLASINVPGISKPTFTHIETQIGTKWEQILTQEIVKAGEEEKRLAIERKDFHHGVPSITVVVDGGWSKRSHKHSYNAKSGVALIIGRETKKLLYLGIRNKYCSICTIAQNKNLPPKQHTCYKNWSGSSSEMEVDILVSGFKSAETMHGLRYMRVIGDGDSSVISSIQQYVPIWGNMVTKVECANHAMKCYRNRLEKIVQDFPKYKGKGGLTQGVMKRLVVGARCAIKMHSSTKNVQQLRKDLRNGPSHVFNDHTHCSPTFCKVAAKTIETNQVQLATTQDAASCCIQDTDSSISSTIDAIITEEVQQEVETHNEEDEARGANTSCNRKDIPDDLFFQILRAGDRLVSMAPQLISNSTSNIAESFMNIRCKFDGGKFYNRIQRGSFQHRAYGAGLRFQLGPDWSSKVWSEATGVAPGELRMAFGEVRVNEHKKMMKRKSSAKYKENRKKTK